MGAIRAPFCLPVARLTGRSETYARYMDTYHILQDLQKTIYRQRAIVLINRGIVWKIL